MSKGETHMPAHKVNAPWIKNTEFYHLYFEKMLVHLRVMRTQYMLSLHYSSRHDPLSTGS